MNKLFCFLCLFSSLFYLSAAPAIEINQMTLEERVGQLLMAYFDGEEANEQAERLIRETKIGGIIYYNWSNGLTDPLKIQKMSRDLQTLALKNSGIPLLIATDQEGGLVARLQNGFTEFPGNAALGRTEQPELAYKTSYFMGQEMKAVGVNFNLAPVVDVNDNSENPVIGIRSFGDDPEMVSRFGRASVEGFRDAGVIPCLKHFPGYGNVLVDPHQGLPIVRKNDFEIENCELYPFKSLVDIAPAIMTAHILFTQIDPTSCATLSPLLLQGILRKKLNFSGVVITDSLTMKGVLEGHKNLDEVALKAFEAGNDILLIGGRDLKDRVDGETNIDEIIRLYHGLIDAVRSGRIGEERVNESVARILKLKEKAGLFEWPSPTRQELVETLQKEKHLDLAHEIAYRSVDVREGSLDEDLSEREVSIIAPKILEEKIRETDLMLVGRQVSLHTFEGLEPSSEDCKRILEQVIDSDYVIFCSYNAWKLPKQRALLEAVSQRKPTACVAVRDPYDLERPNHSQVKIATYSPSLCSLQVVAEWLRGKTRPIVISSDQAEEIGVRVWHNECRNRIDQLTFPPLRNKCLVTGIVFSDQPHTIHCAV